MVGSFSAICQVEGGASESNETSWESAIKQAFKPVQSRSKLLLLILHPFYPIFTPFANSLAVCGNTGLSIH